MNITTKFDIDQTVWFMYNNKPDQGVIRALRVEILPGGKRCEDYDVGLSEDMDGNEVFPSKAALLKSL